jgi:hypothetical protein
MQLQMIEVSLSKEERRIVDEFGNSASTWARIGITAQLSEGDDPAECIAQLKEHIQPEIDDWLLRQGGYINPPGEMETIEEIEERLEGIFGDDVEIQVSEVSPNGDAGHNPDDEEIPL